MSPGSQSKAAAGDPRGRPFAVPAELRDRIAPGAVLETPAACRAALAAAGLCDAALPAVTVELYGGLRLRAKCAGLPLHAATVGEALTVLQSALPNVRRILPAGGELTAHYRFAVNGTTVTTDLGYVLREDDHQIVFSASVGG